MSEQERTDLVNILRERRGCFPCGTRDYHDEAADEIESLSSKLDEARKRLSEEEEAHAELQSRCFEGFPTHSSIFDEYTALQSKLHNGRKLLDDWETAHAQGLGLTVPEGIQRLREALSHG